MPWNDASPSRLGRASSLRLAARAGGDFAEIAIAFAPGRVNLIGEHIDHAGGPVLPFAIDLGVAVAAMPMPETPGPEGPPVRLSSDRRVDAGSIALADSVRRHVWPDGPPLDFAVASSLPPGAGLGSSAALTVAAILAAATLRDRMAGDDPDADDRPPDDGPKPVPRRTGRNPLDVARLAQLVEHEALGVPCGLMDPLAVTASLAGHLVWIDGGSGAYRHVPFEPGTNDLAVLLVDSGTRHRHADGAYRSRLEQLAAAAELLGPEPWPWLAAAGSAQDPAARLPEPLAGRARHVMTEIRRVDEAVRAVEAGDPSRLGPLLDASHRSLRDDFDVSTPQIERLRDVVLDTGREAVRGCRLIGGGFGGCLLAIGPRAALAGRIGTIERRGSAALGRRVRARLVTPVSGARVLAAGG